MASLLYGSGLRPLECCRLRVKDVDFDRNEITVRDGKGQKDRVTLLPARLAPALAAQLERVKRKHAEDLREGLGSVELPGALDRKYPRAAWEPGWQWVFPASRFYLHAESGRRRRHHLHETVLQKAVREAALRAGIAKAATCHSFRHSFATHLLESRGTGGAKPPGWGVLTLPAEWGPVQATWVRFGDVSCYGVWGLAMKVPVQWPFCRGLGGTISAMQCETVGLSEYIGPSTSSSAAGMNVRGRGLQ